MDCFLTWLILGIRYEIVHCDWPDGQPKVGHLEEDARDLR